VRNLLLALALGCAACQGPTPGAWIDLTSTDAWRGYKQDAAPSQWVQDADGFHLAASGGGDLITREQFASFELELDWRISPMGNSGIMFHVSEDRSTTYMTGPEMQVLDNDLFGDDFQALHSAGADYALHPPETISVHPAGEWNTVRITVDGPRVEYWLNGARQCAYELWSEDWTARVAASKFSQWPGFGMNTAGHIALQDHGNVVHYRNLRIRRTRRGNSAL